MQTTINSIYDAGAEFSPCRQYRYSLWRVWAGDLTTARMVAFIGLNPSTADERQDDPTVRRCKAFAQSWGYDGFWMLNLFAFRATDPQVMKACSRPVGDENDATLKRIHTESSLTVACWGLHGSHAGRSEEVLKLLDPPIHCFGMTKGGEPLHPLYLPSVAEIMEMGA